MNIEINAQPRTLQGKGASRRLRIASKVPGILYGGEKTAEPIELDHNELFHKLKLEAFHASILTLNKAGAPERVLLRDFQMHPFRQIILHVDFQRVDENQPIHMKVPLHFTHADIAPGVKVSGGIVSHVLTEIDISCLPKNLPEFIEVDLSQLAAGHSVHLGDLKLPEGVALPSRAKQENPTVATIIIPRAVVADAEATVIAAADVPTTVQKKEVDAKAGAGDKKDAGKKDAPKKDKK